MRLTKRQKDIVIAIESYIDGNGYPPSFREVTRMVGLKAVSSTSRHLDNLKAKGYVSFVPGRSRTLTVVKGVYNE